MAIKANHQYNGRVGSGSHLMESGAGTLGFQIALETDDGETSVVLWLSPKAIESSKKTMVDVLGIPESKLQDGNYVEYQLALDITGRQVGIQTKEETYNGETRVKVAYIRKPFAAAGGAAGMSLAKMAASLFGGKPAAPPPPPPKPYVADDSEIPF